MKITIEIDDDEIRRLLAPLAHQTPPSSEGRTPTRLMTVKDVADRLGVGRNKVYQFALQRRDRVADNRTHQAYLTRCPRLNSSRDRVTASPKPLHHRHSSMNDP